MADQRRAGDFADILASPERPLIVGGQAVNIWAEHYAVSDAQLLADAGFAEPECVWREAGRWCLEL